MTREELIEGIVSDYMKARKRAAKIKGAKNKEVSDFLRKAHQERRQKQLADKPVKLRLASKGMKRIARKRLA